MVELKTLTSFISHFSTETSDGVLVYNLGRTPNRLFSKNNIINGKSVLTKTGDMI